MRRRHAANRRQPRSVRLHLLILLLLLLYFRFAASLPIRGMCQQATIKRLMAISLYAPISVIQSQIRRRTWRRRRRRGHMFVVITCELTRRSLRLRGWGEGAYWLCLATWPGHVSSIRPQTKCYKFFFSAHLELLEEYEGVHLAAWDSLEKLRKMLQILNIF